MRVSIIMPNLLQPDGSGPVLGGIERYARQLISLMLAMGYEVDVHQFASYDWIRRVDQVEVYGYGMASWSQTAALEAMHHNTQSVLYLSIMQVPIRYKPRSVIVAHGVWWDGPQVPPSYVQRSLEQCRQALDEAGHLVSCDYNFLNVMRALYPAIADRITVIPNFVDLSDFSPPASREAGVRVLYPRRLDQCRGADVFVQVVRTLLSEGYRDLTFHMAVDQNHPERNRELADMVQDLGDVLTVSSYPFDAMPEVYRSSQIVVIPSLYSEGTSLACLEAMACGCAVVATDVGGLTNLIINGYNGILMPPRVPELSLAVKYLIDHPRDRELLGKRAAATARAFDVRAWERRWSEVLHAAYPIN